MEERGPRPGRGREPFCGPPLQPFAAFDRAIDVQVSRLRRKLEFDSKGVEMIRTVRNVGYLFTPGVTCQ